jgi:ABC-type Mn2+/Zn2+ transport system ATPase subunit
LAAKSTLPSAISATYKNVGRLAHLDARRKIGNRDGVGYVVNTDSIDGFFSTSSSNAFDAGRLPIAHWFTAPFSAISGPVDRHLVSTGAAAP